MPDPHLPSASPPVLLGAADPAPATLHQGQGRAPLLISCDHAGRAIPASLGRLGLPLEATWQHIAWDLGAGALARRLAARLDAPALLAGYSRLVIDCNRDIAAADAIALRSDGTPVPGNVGLDAAARAARVAAVHAPYHAALAAALAAARRRHPAPALVAVHSFTPVYGTRPRPWHVGVLWDRDPRIAVPLLEWLRARPGLVVGDNQPYSGRAPADYTVDRHGAGPGLPHVCIEVRQDELATPSGIESWAALLEAALRAVLPAVGAGGAR